MSLEILIQHRILRLFMEKPTQHLDIKFRFFSLHVHSRRSKAWVPSTKKENFVVDVSSMRLPLLQNQKSTFKYSIHVPKYQKIISTDWAYLRWPLNTTYEFRDLAYAPSHVLRLVVEGSPSLCVTTNSLSQCLLSPSFCNSWKVRGHPNTSIPFRTIKGR